MTTNPPVTGTPPLRPTPALEATLPVATEADDRPHGSQPVPPLPDLLLDPERLLDDASLERLRRARRWCWPALACLALVVPGAVACLLWGLPPTALLLIAPPWVVLRRLATWRCSNGHAYLELGATGRIRGFRCDDVVDAWVGGRTVVVQDRHGRTSALMPVIGQAGLERVRQALIRAQAETGRPLNWTAAAALGLPPLAGAPRQHPRLRRIWWGSVIGTWVFTVAVVWLLTTFR